MNKIKVYGSPRSSAGRCYWMLEEAGLSYERVPLNMREKEHKSANYLAINPNGKVPALIDGDLTLWESVAINQYLAEKYMPSLTGKTAEEKGLIAMWGLWSMLELQKPAVDWLIQAMFVPEPHRDLKLIEKSQQMIPGLLKILDTALTNKSYLAGPSFTLADLNTASVVNVVTALGVSLESYPNIKTWMSACMDRPGFQRYSKLEA